MIVNRLMSKWQGSNQLQPHGIKIGKTMERSFVGSDGGELLMQPEAPTQRQTFRSLMVPLDGTALGERALPLAASIAKRAQAELRLVHVHEPLQSLYYPSISLGYDDHEYRQQVEYVERISREVADAAGIVVIPECLQKRDIVDGLCDVARQDVDLVIAATHGYEWFERLWHGGIVHKLIERLAPPLLLLRGDGMRAAIAPDRWLRRMLIPLDGLQHAETVLDAATALGSLYDASYSLLGVVPRSDVSQPGLVDGHAAARHYLNEAMVRMTQNSARAITRMAVTDEAVPQAIISRAEASRIDCIAMATGGRSGLARWFQPSVTRRVIHLSQVPVLVVRGEGESREGL